MRAQHRRAPLLPQAMNVSRLTVGAKTQLRA
jgi:hypothetical protein